jgi:mRNA interferase RelE/StbE
VSSDAWSLEFERRAVKDLERLDPPIRDRVVAALQQLIADPVAAQLVKLTGRPEHRLRVGDWRVILELEHATHTVVVLRVLPRGRVYER